MSYAFCCETCDTPDPQWRLTRTGDVTVTWACDQHLAAAVAGLRRDSEPLEVTVVERTRPLVRR